MRVQLLKQHVINDILREPGERLEITADQATPLMFGLDVDAVNAIAASKVRVFGRWLDRAHTQLLDDPPIERPLEESQPVPRVPAGRFWSAFLALMLSAGGANAQHLNPAVGDVLTWLGPTIGADWTTPAAAQSLTINGHSLSPGGTLTLTSGDIWGNVPARSVLGNTTSGALAPNSNWTVSGDSNKLATITGTLINGHVPMFDALGNLVDSGVGPGGGGGGGAVTSVNVSVPATSIFGVVGCPITTSGTCSITTTGTAGGIPYFSSTSQLASSAAGSANTVLHAGNPPTWSAVANADLANNSMTIAGHVVALVGSTTIAAEDLSNGVTGTGAVALKNAPAFIGAFSASGGTNIDSFDVTATQVTPIKGTFAIGQTVTDGPSTAINWFQIASIMIMNGETNAVPVYGGCKTTQPLAVSGWGQCWGGNFGVSAAANNSQAIAIESDSGNWFGPSANVYNLVLVAFGNLGSTFQTRPSRNAIQIQSGNVGGVFLDGISFNNSDRTSVNRDMIVSDSGMNAVNFVNLQGIYSNAMLNFNPVSAVYGIKMVGTFTTAEYESPSLKVAATVSSSNSRVRISGSSSGNPVINAVGYGGSPATNSHLAFQALGTGHVQINPNGSTLTIDAASDHTTFYKPIRLWKQFGGSDANPSISDVPTCDASHNGWRYFVTDSNVNNFGQTVGGGGTNSRPIFCDGSTWKVG